MLLVLIFTTFVVIFALDDSVGSMQIGASVPGCW